VQGSNFCSFSNITTKLGMREVHDQDQGLGVHEVPGQDRNISCSLNKRRSKARQGRKYDSPK